MNLLWPSRQQSAFFGNRCQGSRQGTDFLCVHLGGASVVEFCEQLLNHGATENTKVTRRIEISDYQALRAFVFLC